MRAPISRLAALLGLNSFRGDRFIYMVALSACCMVVTARIAEMHVNNATLQGVSNTADQQKANSDALGHLKNALAKSVALLDFHYTKRSPADIQEAQYLVANLKQLKEEIIKVEDNKLRLAGQRNSNQQHFVRIRSSTMA